jgi:hypothetical protein
MKYLMKRNDFLVWCCSSIVLISSFAAKAQALPGSVRPIVVQGGVGFSFAKPDFVPLYAATGFPYIKGFTAYADATYYQRVGLEAEVHFDSIFTPADIGENTYMVGPRVVLIHEDRMNLYAKGMGGLAAFEYQKGDYPNPHADTYGAFGAGAGIDFRASRHINVRAIDVEQQWWPSFTPKELRPLVVTFGVAYTE